MAKVNKTPERSIFPLNPSKKKSQYETELNKTINVPNHEEPDTENKHNNDNEASPKQLINPIIEDETIEESVPSIHHNMPYDEVVTEEIMVKIVNELGKSSKIMSILSNTIAERLLEQMSTTQTVSFINENIPNGVNPDTIYLKENLLKYSAVIQDRISMSIKQITSNLLTNKR